MSGAPAAGGGEPGSRRWRVRARRLSLRTRAVILLLPLAAVVAAFSIVVIAPYHGLSGQVGEVRARLGRTMKAQSLARLLAEQRGHWAEYASAAVGERPALGREISATDAAIARRHAELAAALASDAAPAGALDRAMEAYAERRATGRSVVELVDAGRTGEARALVADAVVNADNAAPARQLADLVAWEERAISGTLLTLAGSVGRLGPADVAGLRSRLEGTEQAAARAVLAARLEALVIMEVSHYAELVAVGEQALVPMASQAADDVEQVLTLLGAARLAEGEGEGGDGDESARVEVLRAGHVELAAVGGRAVRLARQGRPGEATAVFREELSPLADRLVLTTAAGLRDAAVAEVDERLRRAGSAATRLETVLGGVLLAAMGLVLAAVRTVSRRVVRPVLELRRAAREVGAGELGARVPVYGPDEVGALGADFNAMVEQLAASRRALVSAAVAESSTDVVVTVDDRGRISYASAAAEGVLGHAPDALRGRLPLDLAHDDDGDALLALRDGGAQAVEVRLRHASGAWVDTEVKRSDLRGDPHVRAEVLTIRDIGERKRAEAALAHQTFHDALTGLPNRAYALDRLAHVLGVDGGPPRAVGVLFCDLDNFKAVNDSVGHEAGDELLAAAGQRLRDNLRPQDTACRLGGDEFALLVHEPVDAGYVADVARRLVDAFGEPFALYGRRFFVSMSIGSTLGRAGQSVPDQLLREADIALRRAKAGGKARVEPFHASMLAGILHRVELEAQLRRALDEGGLDVHYQPKFDACSLSVVGVEALVRWPHPVRGAVPPGEFVPVAEESGLVGRLGQWMLERACRQARQWRDLHGVPLTVAVNVSARQLQQPGLVDLVADVLAASGLPPRALVLEITETSLSEDGGTPVTLLAELKDVGVQLSIDDFGTGYSSLSRLREFPIDELKIDKSFVQEIVSADGDAPLVTAMISMAHALGRRVVAEGVEIPEQLEFLRSRGCDQLQGFLLGRPVPASEAAPLFEGGRASGAFPGTAEGRDEGAGSGDGRRRG